MKKRTITLAFDCYIGPIVGVAVDENGREITKIRVVDDDVDVRQVGGTDRFSGGHDSFGQPNES